MSQSQYPLQALLKLRQQVKKKREQQLAEALAAQLRAEQKVAAQQEKITRQQQDIKKRQAQMFGEAPNKAQQLQRQQDYLRGLSQKLSEMQTDLDAQRQDYAAAASAHLAAQQALRQAEADLKAVNKNFATWDEARQKAEEQRAEEELEANFLNKYARRT